MADYYWKWHREDWPRRFPKWAQGYELWRKQSWDAVREVREVPEWLLEERRPELRRDDRCPRVFISHKREDEDKALHVATLAKREGMEVWLDVLDPTLQGIDGAGSMEDDEEAVFIASVIEMAILNCSHVIVVYTRAATRSRWVPYEYGRVKQRQPVSKQAACWLTAGVGVSGADYLHLGVVCRSEREVNDWLSSQARPDCQAVAGGDLIPKVAT